MPPNCGLVETSTVVVWTWLKQFWKALAYAIQKIYILWGLFSIFGSEFAKTYFYKWIKHLEISQFWHPKMNLKKTFLKTYKGNVLASYGKNVSARRVFGQLSLFLMMRAFDRWQLECHSTWKKIFWGRNSNFFVFHKRIQTTIANPL